MSNSFDACSALISIRSQPFAQVLLCFSSGALLLKNMWEQGWILTVEWEILFPMGEYDFFADVDGSNSECHVV